MTPEEMMDVLSAYRGGAKIEWTPLYVGDGGGPIQWEPTLTPRWDFATRAYRVKPPEIDSVREPKRYWLNSYHDGCGPSLHISPERAIADAYGPILSTIELVEVAGDENQLESVELPQEVAEKSGLVDQIRKEMKATHSDDLDTIWLGPAEAKEAAALWRSQSDRNAEDQLLAGRSDEDILKGKTILGRNIEISPRPGIHLGDASGYFVPSMEWHRLHRLEIKKRPS